MIGTSLAHPAHDSRPRAPFAARAERALKLFAEHGADIRHIGRETFLVPSCSSEARRHYLVRYGGTEESCGCPDFAYRGEACKHLLCVGIAHAARRSGVKVRTIASLVAGDGFKAAAKRRSKSARCDGCGHRYPARGLIEVQDWHESLTHFEGDLLCEGCARDAGIL